jgi:hypothetical protein
MTRLEQKHDNELREVFLRLGRVEGVATVVEDRQVGLPKCMTDMGAMRNAISEASKGAFTMEEKQRILTTVEIIQSKKKVWTGITITVVSLCIMGIISFGLFMFGSHNPGKRIEEIEKQSIERSQQVDKSIQKLQAAIEENSKILNRKNSKE